MDAYNVFNLAVALLSVFGSSLCQDTPPVALIPETTMAAVPSDAVVFAAAIEGNTSATIVDNSAMNNSLNNDFVVETTTVKLNTTGMNCTTGFSDAGVCIERQYCDYGTPAIDKTLYEPNDYVKFCSSAEVCCPREFILVNRTEDDESASRIEEDDFF